MNDQLQFSGVWCPSVTPFDSQGKLDLIGLERHLRTLTDANIDGVLLMGSIGEFTSLTQSERISLIRNARSMTPLSMIANVSSTCIEDMAQLADLAFQAGYDAVLALPHYYFGQTEHQLEAYFRQLNQLFAGRWLAYNFPARTGCDLSAPLVAKLAAELPRFVGIKDTVDCLSHTRILMQTVLPLRPDFAVFAGYDEYLLPNWMGGGAGVISGLNNLAPELFAQARDAYQAQDMAQLVEIHQEIARLSAIYTVGDDFVTTIKTAVARRYHSIEPVSRSPGASLAPKQIQAIDDILYLK